MFDIQYTYIMYMNQRYLPRLKSARELTLDQYVGSLDDSQAANMEKGMP
jgi:excinuclease UvrABC nuclease subunit